MKKHEIIYDWPIVEILRLSDSQQAESFSETLSDAPLDTFVALTEQMRGLGADLAKAKADRVHFLKWNELRLCIEQFNHNFATFPNLTPKKFQFSLLLAEKLALAGPALDTENIEPGLFEVRGLANPLPFAWFSHENSQSFADSVATFSCADISGLEAQLATSNMSPRFVFHILGAVNSLPDIPASYAVVLKRTIPAIPSEAAEAFARLVVLASGKSVHAARNYLHGPRVLDLDGIRAGHAYHQWNEVLHVLSEYNNRREVLLKYLTIYHVIENFMFKLPIVELERQHNGRMFSIRDFRRLYKRVDEGELEALKRLLGTVLSLNVAPGKTFAQHVVDRWLSLVPAVSTSEIEAAMGTLDIKKSQRPLKHNEFKTGGEAAGYLAQMVYGIRNAIVHNKETEFHLTYASLDAKFCVLIESFLIPTLEEISFALVGSPNQHVWYTNKEFVLY